MYPLDPLVDYGITERSYLDIEDVQLELLPDKVHVLRQKLHQKAKAEPKFRFYALYDRVYRKAVLLLLEPIYEADFMDCSHGFRPKRKAHDALDVIWSNLKAGRTEVYDADLKGYFDSIPHDKLMACVRMRVVDSSVLKLIRMWLKAPIIEMGEKGRMQPPKKNRSGTPQGGVISPLLANAYLHWFDVMFHRQAGPHQWANARLVRYADDFVILARYQGNRIDEWVKETLEEWMGLQLNQAKTTTVKLWRGEGLDFLGYTFQNHRDLHGRDKTYLNVYPSKKSIKRARQTLKEKTSPRNCFKPATEVVKDLNRYLQGWGNYFNYGYSRKGRRDVSHHARGRMIRHLNRRSQRKYARPKGMSHYRHLEKLGLVRL